MWSNGCVVVWSCGRVVVWLYGGVVVWLCGYVWLWCMVLYLVVWLLGYKRLKDSEATTSLGGVIVFSGVVDLIVTYHE